MLFLSRHMNLVCLLCAVLCTAGTTRAQILAEEAEPLRFSGRLLSLSAGAGPALYTGEFSGSVTGMQATLGLGYSIFPELTLAFSGGFGRLSLERSRDGHEPVIYDFQFPGDREAVLDRSISFTAFDLSGQLNLFPRTFTNVFLTAGAGITFYQAEDFDDGRVRPIGDFPASVAIPVGAGGELFLWRNVSATLLLRHTFLFNGDFDAYDPEALAEEYNRVRNAEIDVPSAGGDGYFTATLGVRYYLFESGDYDGDLLSNSEENEIGTSPHKVDTDVDGLTDYEEVRIHTTNPLRPDTDDDGLGDYFEITKYGTDPKKPDTDSDCLSDADEIDLYDTDPLKPDTDEDMLSDYEEVILFETDPRNPDTDYDGLDDFAEVKVHDTDPLRPDTDDDGIFDFNEVVTYRTDPRNGDSDSDILLDYDEISYYGTNPLNPDTDGDGIGDAEEVFTSRTDPLTSDGQRAVQPPPASGRTKPYYAELIETRPLPGGGVSYLITPAVSRRPAQPPVDLDSLVAAVPMYDSSYAQCGAQPVTTTYTRRAYHRVQAAGRPSPPPAKGKPLRIDTLHLRKGDMLTFCNITFAFDRDELREEYLPLLRESVHLFVSHPEMVVEIRGHTDNEGSVQYNQDLSERRAASVKDYLVSQGVSAARLHTVGFGELQPIADSDTEEGRARNRRVEFFVVKLDSGEEETR